MSKETFASKYPPSYPKESFYTIKKPSPPSNIVLIPGVPEFEDTREGWMWYAEYLRKASFNFGATLLLLLLVFIGIVIWAAP
jgi:hypothetical protein